MKTHFIPALKLTLLTVIFFGVVYPILMVGVATLVGLNGGKGELVKLDGKTVGFRLIGQAFDSSAYFNGRPSAVGYNAAATGGSNKGPTNQEYLRQVENRINDFLAKNPGINRSEIPVDLVTASGSGLDPDISEQAAFIQIPRIAKARKLSEGKLRILVGQHVHKSLLNFWGRTTSISVLELNLSLDQLAH